MAREIEQLEALGFYRETYAAARKRFADWNKGVLTHRWWLATGLPCALCGSPEPSVVVQLVALCLTCLNAYPSVPWHPNGAVRPRTTEFLSHALSCTSHSSPPTGTLPTSSETGSGS